jgi:hypothetical protein
MENATLEVAFSFFEAFPMHDNRGTSPHGIS